MATPALAEDLHRIDDNDAEYDEDNDVIEVHGGHAGEELVSRNQTFKPLCVMSTWKHDTTKDLRVSAALLLPTRIDENAGDIRVGVEGDEQLSVGVAWLSALTNPKMMKKKWLIGDGVERIEDDRPMGENFYEFLAKF